VTIPPTTQLWQLATGHFLARCLHVIAELGVADHLEETELPIEALAPAATCQSDSLERILRLLATAGIFEKRDRGWAHTELSRLLRSDHPQSMRAFARMIGSQLNWSAAGELEHTARTGHTAVERLAPMGMWSYLREHPDEARVFDAAMTAKSNAEIAALIPAFDFSRYGVIADIGGGRGHVIRAVLDTAPEARGVLFDLPDVISSVTASPRLELRSGDFFKDALPSADAYLLSNVIHDWPDEQSIPILDAVRRAAHARSELLVIESLLPEGPGPHVAKVLDIVMLTITCGRERTRAAYQALLKAGGFRLDRVVPTASPVSIILGIPE
jgi:hypothetical protein